MSSWEDNRTTLIYIVFFSSKPCLITIYMQVHIYVYIYIYIDTYIYVQKMMGELDLCPFSVCFKCMSLFGVLQVYKSLNQSVVY